MDTSSTVMYFEIHIRARKTYFLASYHITKRNYRQTINYSHVLLISEATCKLRATSRHIPTNLSNNECKTTTQLASEKNLSSAFIANNACGDHHSLWLLPLASLLPSTHRMSFSVLSRLLKMPHFFNFFCDCYF